MEFNSHSAINPSTRVSHPQQDLASKTNSVISTNGSLLSNVEKETVLGKTKAALFIESLDQQIKKMKQVCQSVRGKKQVKKNFSGEGQKVETKEGEGTVKKIKKLLESGGEVNQRKSVEWGQGQKPQISGQLNKFSLPLYSSKKETGQCKPTKVTKGLSSLQEVKHSQSFIEDDSSQSSNESVVQGHGMSIFNWNSMIGRACEFKLIRYLDEGQFGKVFLAQQFSVYFRSHKNNAIYSIKTLYLSTFSEDTIHQLIRELKIQSYLQHPNIVKLYHFFVDQDCAYMVLQPCLDGSLQKILENQKALSEKTVQEIMRQVCTALDYMHQNNVLHRDIKPQNILMHENLVKICDFGWAVHSPLLRETKCGTPLYSPPEMVKNLPYDSKIDIWCIGVLAYELLYGTIPFEIREQEDLTKIIEQQVQFSRAEDVSDAAKDFILSCLAKDPAKRPTVKELMKHQLFWKQDNKYRLSMAI